MAQNFLIGNTFDATSTSYGHARKVWRRIDEQLPGGWTVNNVSDFVSDGIIKSGMAVTLEDADARTVNVLAWADLATNVSDIIGFVQEDAVITDSSTYATVNVVVKGEIYGYMLGDDETTATTNATAVKAMTQLNGLSIRVVD